MQARARGLPVTIYRPGLITGDSQTGLDSAAAGQFFSSLLRGCVEMGVDAGLVGSTAHRAGGLCGAGRRRRGAAFGRAGRRPGADQPPTAAVHRDREDAEGRGLSDAHRALRELARGCASPGPNGADQPAGPFGSFLEGLSDEEAALEVFGAQDALHDERTLALLEAAGVVCPPADPDLVRRYCRWYQSEGLMAPPPRVEADEEGGLL